MCERGGEIVGSDSEPENITELKAECMRDIGNMQRGCSLAPWLLALSLVYRIPRWPEMLQIGPKLKMASSCVSRVQGCSRVQAVYCNV